MQASIHSSIRLSFDYEEMEGAIDSSVEQLLLTGAQKKALKRKQEYLDYIIRDMQSNILTESAIGSEFVDPSDRF